MKPNPRPASANALGSGTGDTSSIVLSSPKLVPEPLKKIEKLVTSASVGKFHSHSERTSELGPKPVTSVSRYNSFRVAENVCVPVPVS